MDRQEDSSTNIGQNEIKLRFFSDKVDLMVQTMYKQKGLSQFWQISNQLQKK